MRRSSTVHQSGPASPSTSRFHEPSHTEQFPELPAAHYAANPAQAARIPTNHSHGDMVAYAQQQKANVNPNLPKSQSMVFTPPGGPNAQAPPMPPMTLSPTSTFPQITPTMSRTDSIVNMDGSQPSMFPGVVMNRQRRSSLQRPDSSGDAGLGGSGQSWGRRSEVGEAVTEEDEISPNKTPPAKN